MLKPRRLTAEKAVKVARQVAKIVKREFAVPTDAGRIDRDAHTDAEWVARRIRKIGGIAAAIGHGAIAGVAAQTCDRRSENVRHVR